MLRDATQDRNKVRARLAGVEDRLAAWVQQLNEAMYPGDATTKRDAEELITEARHWREVYTSLSSRLDGLWKALGSPAGHYGDSAWIVAEAERRLLQSQPARWSPDVPTDQGAATEGGAVLRPSPASDVQKLHAELARSLRDGRHLQILPAPGLELRRWRLTLRDSSNPSEVEAVATDLGGLRLSDGTIIGPAAILRAEPLVAQVAPPASDPSLPDPAPGLVVWYLGTRLTVSTVARFAVYTTEGKCIPRSEWLWPRVQLTAGASHV